MNTLSGLRLAVQGQVLLPGDDGFEQARQPWNLAVEQSALAVVTPADADDVSAVLRYAGDAGVPVTVQPSGHGASGNAPDAILLRTTGFDQIEVDAARRTARIGAGVRSGQVQEVAAGHGLTGLPGSNPVVSVTGFTLGGGLSWFARKYGWAAAHVTAFEVVDAAGGQARVTADSDPDLFWALRGGGGDFAVVTAMEYALHAEPVLFGGRMMWPAGRTAQVLAAFIAVTASAPEELTTWVNLFQFPGSPPLVSIDATYLGAEPRARDLLAAFDSVKNPISDTRAVLPVSRIGTITAEPTDPSPGLSRSELLTGLDEGVVKTLLSDPIDPLVNVQIRHLGGALARGTDIPPGPVPEPYGLNLLGVPMPRERAAAIRARQAELVAALGGHVTGRKPFTLLTPGADTAASAFGAQAHNRLRQIKRDRDPRGVIRGNFPVLD